MDVGVPRYWNSDPALVKAALVVLQRGGQTTLKNRWKQAIQDRGFWTHDQQWSLKLVEVMMMKRNIVGKLNSQGNIEFFVVHRAGLPTQLDGFAAGGLVC
ncbi:jg7766 [Pararge aegeria aegeria]|uniref:Jg7766 protein n=1 Tax=Pararge aegeria aegeria TaxID=348720 RepID=A0A8S4QSM6_9NEOP|nr:jg7766 [Pararge aegeria aegeria]